MYVVFCNRVICIFLYVTTTKDHLITVSSWLAYLGPIVIISEVLKWTRNPWAIKRIAHWFGCSVCVCSERNDNKKTNRGDQKGMYRDEYRESLLRLFLIDVRDVTSACGLQSVSGWNPSTPAVIMTLVKNWSMIINLNFFLPWVVSILKCSSLQGGQTSLDITGRRQKSLRNFMHGLLHCTVDGRDYKLIVNIGCYCLVNPLITCCRK